MDPRDQKKITSNLLRIKKGIQKDIAAITETLVEESVFTAAVRSEIIGVRPSHLQSGMFINKLLRSGADAYRKFIKVLEEIGLTSLVAKLENSDREATEPNLQVTERERTFILPNPQILSKFQEDAYQPCQFAKKLTQSEAASKGAVHLERMMTFVLSHCEDTGRNSRNHGFIQRVNHASKDISNMEHTVH